MKKQTKLVAVLSTASLLAIGASMTSFAATGWVEENGTWVYYNRDGELATDSWKKSGNSWYWLDDNGEMAVDQLIEDDGDYYYVDINGVMATNQWVAIENEDAGDDDEPDQNWYYFQANGKALKNTSDKVALKTINGKKYAFDDEGKMLWGWVSEDDAEHIDNTDGDAFETGVYYFGDSDDGAMTVGWIQLDITYDGITDDDTYNALSPVFTDDEDQTRWFYFQNNGKKVQSDDADEIKERSINGKKYGFDHNGAMVAEWSVDVEEASKQEVDILASASTEGTRSYATGKYAQQWRYFQSVEDGSKLSRGWFKVVSAEYLNEEKYDDDEEAWYYADGKGDLYAGEFKTISGKKYAFRNDGRMIDGLKFIKEEGNDDLDVIAWDTEDPRGAFDTEDDFLANAWKWEADGYHLYYFGDGEDGAMKTGKTTVSLDGESFVFNFETSGSKKGRGTTGEDDDKYYQSGMLLSAGNDEKYQILQPMNWERVEDEDGNPVLDANGNPEWTFYAYGKYEDFDDFLTNSGLVFIGDLDGEIADEVDARDYVQETYGIDVEKLNKDGEDITELYVIDWEASEEAGFDWEDFKIINKSGKVVDNDTRVTDGEDYTYVTGDNGKIMAIYVED